MDQGLLKNIQWLGHSAFRLNVASTIYIDPYELKAATPQADIILITHEHYDHLSLDDIARVRRPDTVFVTQASSAQKLEGDVRVMKPGERMTVEGFEIETVPAYNIDKKFHPKSAGHVGFIITIDGHRIYHAGDTDCIPEMSDVRADIALLPVSGTYVMTAEEAVQAAEQIKPQLVIPMHYGSVAGDVSDAQRFAEMSPVDTLILTPAEA